MVQIQLAVALLGCAWLLPVAYGQIIAGRINGTQGFGNWPNGSAIVVWNMHSTMDPGQVTPNVPLVTARPPDASDLWTNPASMIGQEEGDFYPYDQTWTIPYQNLTMISFYQLRVFMKYYNQMMTNVANACNVSLADAPKAWYKQVAYTWAVWFPETLAFWKLTDVEKIWTDQTVDNEINDKAIRFHTQITAIYNNDTGTIFTYADYTGYIWHKWNLRYPANKIVLSNIVNLQYAMMETVKFFLGTDVLTSEVFSAFDNVFMYTNAINWHHLDMYDIDCIRRVMPSSFIIPNGALQEIYPDLGTKQYDGQ